MDTLPSISHTIILGDQGSHVGPLSTTHVNEQGRILSQYLSLWNFVSAHLHKSHLSSSHTFESKAHSTVSTIDHILCHQSFLPRFQSTNPLPEHPLNTSHHLPVVASIQLYCSQLVPSEQEARRKPAFNPRSWSRISKHLATSKNIPPKVYQHFKKPGWGPMLKPP